MKALRWSIILAAVLTGTAAWGQAPAASPYPDQARSMVVSRYGIVATSQTLASQAGARILDRGGSAVDAAIAANAVLGIAEPMTNGIGGDLLAIVYEAKTGKVYGLDSTGWAPAGLNLDVLKSQGIAGKPDAHSIHLVTVPGAVAGWDALHQKFGKLPFRDLLESATYYAGQGLPLAELTAAEWQPAQNRFSNIPSFRDVYLPDGKAPKTGQIITNKTLAATLRTIAAQGRDGFYKGAVAKELVRYSDSLGGTMTGADLEQFQPTWVEPISTNYRGWTVWELPPSGQGVAALSMLNLMELFPLSEYGQNSARALHVMIEAKKLAYADLAQYIGDPKFSTLPVPELISKDLARKRAAQIDPAKAHCQVLPSELSAKLNATGKDTTYLTVADSEGNIVSLIQSLYDDFGTGLVVPEAGFVLQNRGGNFDFEPGKTNSLAPHKRPLTTLIPAFMEKGDVKIGFGIMGGFNQGQAHAQFVSDIVDFGFNPQAALEAPRFTKSTFEGCDIRVESRIPEDTRAKLKELGHEVRATGPFALTMGRGNAIMIDGQGIHYGASDPRGDGAAIPQSPPIVPVALP